MGKKHGQNDWDTEEKSIHSQGSQEGTGEDLNEYIRVTSPGVLVVIVALFVMLAAVIVWGFIGTLPVTETVTGLVVNTAAYAKMYPEKADDLPSVEEGEVLVYCFVDASRYNGQAIRDFGDDVSLRMPDQKSYKGKIDSVFRAPVSREEAKKILFDNEWVLDECVAQDYNWWLTIRPTEDMSQYVFTLSEVTLLTDEVAPIYFLMR